MEYPNHVPNYVKITITFTNLLRNSNNVSNSCIIIKKTLIDIDIKKIILFASGYL